MNNAYILYNIYIIKGQKHCFEMLLPFFCFFIQERKSAFSFPLLCQFNFYSDIADTWKDFSLHIMAHGDMDGVALVHLIHVDGEVVLIVADTLSGAGTVFSDELAEHGIGFFYTIFLLVGGIDGLVHDER